MCLRQSIEDGVTLEIVYEGRTHNAEVSDTAGMDTAFQDVFSDYNLPQRMEILGYGSRDAYLEAEPTIEAKAKDMVEHYLTHVFPNGYKAQIVATSREAAVRYKRHIDAAIAKALSVHRAQIVEIAAVVMQAKGMPSADAAFKEIVAERALIVLRRLVKRGAVTKSGTSRNAQWALALSLDSLAPSAP
jgi:type I site-specific restriction-modification system R (restriction) subunit